MSVELTFHRCKKLRLARTFVSNANSVTLAIEHDSGVTEIILYDLPAETTAKLEQFRDEQTTDFTETDDGHVNVAVKDASALPYEVAVDIARLPEGVTAIGLDDPAEMHNTLKRIFGE